MGFLLHISAMTILTKFLISQILIVTTRQRSACMLHLLPTLSQKKTMCHSIDLMLTTAMSLIIGYDCTIL